MPCRRCLSRPLKHDLPPLAAQIMAQRGRQWPVGATLGVRFLNGSPSLQAKVMARFHAWTEQAGNLAYKQVNTKSAEIRVAFPNDGASWSLIGTDALQVPLDQQTINLGWFDDSTDDAELDRTGLHEIGHQRSYGHEHTRPENQKILNKAAVYADLEGPPNNWTAQEVTDQVFPPFNPNQWITTPFDINSIMEYPFSASDTLNHQPIIGGQELTAYDIALDRQLYPWPATPTTTPPVLPVQPAGDNWTVAAYPGGGTIFQFGRGHLGGNHEALSLILKPMASAPAPEADNFHFVTPKPGETLWTVGHGRIDGRWFEIIIDLDASAAEKRIARAMGKRNLRLVA